MIILDEEKYILDILNQRDGIENILHVSHKLAKYYWQTENSPAEIYNKIISFLKLNNPYFNEVKYSKLIKSAIKKQKGKSIISIKYIPVTEKELDIIKNIEYNNVKIMKGAQKVAFTLLCLAKYNNIVYPTNSNWVSNSHTEIFSLANLRCTLKDKYAMISLLIDLGLIEMPKKLTNNNFNIKFLDTSPDAIEVMQITDFRSLGNQYLAYLGYKYEPCVYCGVYVMSHKGSKPMCTECKKDPPDNYKYITCKECGRTVKIDKIVKKQEYCPECYKEHRKIQNRLSKRKERANMSALLTDTLISEDAQ